MSGLYWANTALDLISFLHEGPEKSEISNYCKSCYKDGGFSAAPGHNPHILYTLSAIQLALTHDLIDYSSNVLFPDSKHSGIPFSEVKTYILRLIQENGAVSGSDKWIDLDTRFNFCAVASLKLLKML